MLKTCPSIDIKSIDQDGESEENERLLNEPSSLPKEFEEIMENDSNETKAKINTGSICPRIEENQED